MCSVLQVSCSGYYQWRKDEQSPRQADDDRLIDLIRILHAESFGSYGVIRMAKGLKQQGINVNAKRIRRLMRQIGLRGKGEPKKNKFIATTDSNHKNPVAENTLNRKFTVDIPNTRWVSDITYIWTQEGWFMMHPKN